MKLGVICPQTEGGTDVAAISEFVRAVEALGFDHLFVADHVLGADPKVHLHPSLATYSHEAAYPARLLSQLPCNNRTVSGSVQGSVKSSTR